MTLFAFVDIASMYWLDFGFIRVMLHYYPSVSLIGYKVLDSLVLTVHCPFWFYWLCNRGMYNICVMISVVDVLSSHYFINQTVSCFFAILQTLLVCLSVLDLLICSPYICRYLFASQLASWWIFCPFMVWMFFSYLTLSFFWIWHRASSISLYTRLDYFWIHFLFKKIRYYQAVWFGQISGLEFTCCIACIPSLVYSSHFRPYDWCPAVLFMIQWVWLFQTMMILWDLSCCTVLLYWL